jgi:hypothetical protein
MKRTVKQETTLQAVVDEFAALNGEENTAWEASNTPPVDNPAWGASDGNSEADTGNSTASANTAIEVEAEVATE